MNENAKAQRRGASLRHGLAALVVMVAGVLLGLSPTLATAAPAAGTVIGNQATATYTDALGATRNATSNLVQTTVAQVKSFTLTASGARTAAPGQTVYYPHTIQNTGNGTDTYSLPTGVGGLTSTNFTPPGAPHGSLAYYLDANGDGIPDSGTPIATSGPIAAGQFFRFVVAGTVPAGATFGTTAQITVVANDTGANTASNTDTTTVQDSAISVNKLLSVPSGPSPSVASIVVTLAYTNSGNSAATNLQITDTLPSAPGATMTYVPGSGRWSVTGLAFPGTTPLSDASDGIEYAGTNPPGIDYRFSGGVVTAIIGTVPAGVSGSVQFRVDIPANQLPGAITNFAQYQTTTQPSQTTNGATYTVLQTAAVAFNGSAASNAANANDPLVVASAAAGTTLTYDNYVWNKGNAADTFDVTTVSNTFPAGTTVQILQNDGASALLNSGGSAAPDTGPIPGPGQPCNAPFVSVGGFCGYHVVVKVTLPANATTGGSLVLRATSVFNNAVTDDVTDTLTAVTANSVDITNNLPATDPGATIAANGKGPGAGAVITTNVVTPSTGGSTTTRFLVYVTNTGAVADSFTLTAALAVSSNPAVVVPTLPAGWSVGFRADGGLGNCTTVGAALGNTGALAPNANRLICAEVTIPSTTTGTAFAGNFDFDFTATSATNPLVTDVKRDRVTVNVVHSITLVPPNTQQTFPGGSVTYNHTLTNAGNAADTVSFLAGCLVDSRSAQGYTSAAYVDANGNGTLEVGTDTLVVCGSTTVNLAIGESRAVFVRVFAPGSAVAADPANVTTLTASFTGGTAFVNDTTSVTDGLLLVKEQQAVGTAGCTNNNPAAGSYVPTPIAAGPNTVPGACIAYRITATNTTAGTITSVVISDIVPPNTKMRFSCSGNGVSSPSVTGGTGGAMAGGSAADNATGTVIANVASLGSTQAARLYFCVMIDP